jgi:ADP-heptose:LPS heptosyltransferase
LDKPLGLLATAALMRELNGILSVDTGLAHVALAQELPTVVLLAGGNPLRFFPWPDAKNHLALTIATPCAGCNNRCTQNEPFCLTMISPSDVVEAFQQVTSQRRAGTREETIFNLAEAI